MAERKVPATKKKATSQEIVSENILNLGSTLTIRDVAEWRDKMMQALLKKTIENGV